jgi:hypothetical protein
MAKKKPFQNHNFFMFHFLFSEEKNKKNKIPPRNNTSLAFSVTAERLVKHSPVKPAALSSQLPRSGIVQ